MSAYEIQARISVPSSLPITTRLSAPALKILKTIQWYYRKMWNSSLKNSILKALVLAMLED